VAHLLATSSIPIWTLPMISACLLELLDLGLEVLATKEWCQGLENW